MSQRPARALCLMSGGLDSMLAARLMMEIGASVIGFTCRSCFSHKEFTGKELGSVKSARELGIPIVVEDVSRDLWNLVRHPKFGHGSHLNPCIDCKVMMLGKARRFMDELGADVVVTGEVMGQRPMSQRKEVLYLISKETGLKGKLLRPLSARLMEPTDAEKQGLIDRERLMDIHGRTRKVQLELARRWGLTAFGSPAGGCLLTDPKYEVRLTDLLARVSEYDAREVSLLSIGRHFRLGDRSRAIVARNEAECGYLESMALAGDDFLLLRDAVGPACLIPGGADETQAATAASLMAHYSRHTKGGDDVAVRVRRVGGAERVVRVRPAEDAQARDLAVD